MQDLIKVAAQEIGVKEIEGSEHNERILQYAKEIGFDWYDSDETSWCSVFLNWVTMKAGYQRSKDGRSRSWMNVGEASTHPEPGDIVVFWWGDKVNSTAGHAGIYMGYSHDQRFIYVLGGNQSDSVAVTPFPATNLLGFRKIKAAGAVTVPNPILKPGDYNDQVKQLQDALRLVGIDVGPSDGDYGPKTENAIKELQAKSDKVEDTGIYDEATRDFLNGLLKLMVPSNE